MHKIALSAILLGALASASIVRADEMTTRDEKRPQGGAHYTVEKGVRVWRMQPSFPQAAVVHRDDKGSAGDARFHPGPFHPWVEPAYSGYSTYPNYVYPDVGTGVAPYTYGGVRSGFSYLPQINGGGYSHSHRGRFGASGHHGHQFGLVGVRHHGGGHAVYGHGGGGPVMVRSFGGKVQHGHGPGHGGPVMAGGKPGGQAGGMSGGKSGGSGKH